MNITKYNGIIGYTIRKGSDYSSGRYSGHMAEYMYNCDGMDLWQWHGDVDGPAGFAFARVGRRIIDVGSDGTVSYSKYLTLDLALKAEEAVLRFIEERERDSQCGDDCPMCNR